MTNPNTDIFSPFGHSFTLPEIGTQLAFCWSSFLLNDHVAFLFADESDSPYGPTTPGASSAKSTSIIIVVCVVLGFILIFLIAGVLVHQSRKRASGTTWFPDGFRSIFRARPTDPTRSISSSRKHTSWDSLSGVLDCTPLRQRNLNNPKMKLVFDLPIPEG